ncbi:MAG: hypothetical protein R2715_19955 [Ilumatobacteraceae bacterium]
MNIAVVATLRSGPDRVREHRTVSLDEVLPAEADPTISLLHAS